MQYPIDADDDLIASNIPDDQKSRGLSEMSAHLRQIAIRRITSKVQSRLYRSITPSDFETREKIAHELLADLDTWRQSVLPASEVQSPYQTTTWANLNYERERLSCLKALVLPNRVQPDPGSLKYIMPCLDSAMRVLHYYGELCSNDRLMMNWTGVQDLLGSGFVLLFCILIVHSGTQRTEISPLHADEEKVYKDAIDTIELCSDLLSQIAMQWNTVKQHQHIFHLLSQEIKRQIQYPPEQMLWQNGHQIMDTSECEPVEQVPSEFTTAFPNDLSHFQDFDFDALDWDGIFASESNMLDFDLPTIT